MIAVVVVVVATVARLDALRDEAVCGLLHALLAARRAQRKVPDDATAGGERGVLGDGALEVRRFLRCAAGRPKERHSNLSAYSRHYQGSR